MKGKFIIIAGTNKAGTTSFFEYLAAHPSVCPSYIKQTFFFLDKDWQHNLHLPSLYDYNKGIHQYRLFFRNHIQGQYRLEASPEYMYAPGTPERIFKFSQTHETQIVFILRNPVARFISLFHFGKQQCIIDEDCSFETFLQLSKNYTAHDNPSLMAYETGFYSRYLERYCNLFGRENLCVYFFEDFMADTKSFMHRVCTDLSLDESFYKGYAFITHNKTIAVKSRALRGIYNTARHYFMKKTFKSKIGYNTSMLLKKTITPIYRKINVTELKQEKPALKDVQFLEDAYKEEKNNIEKLLGIHVPW